MGYVFFCLVILFVTLSLTSKKTVDADTLDENQIAMQLKYSKIFFVLAIICYAVGIVGVIEPSMRALGFESIFFLATVFLVLSIYLRSNAKDKVQDPKCVAIDLNIFKTDKAFNIGACGVIAILAILYIWLW